MPITHTVMPQPVPAPMPANAQPGDFLLVSFDGPDPNVDPSNVNHWLTHGGLVRIAQWADGTGFGEFEHAAVYIGENKLVQAQSAGVSVGSAHSYDGNTTMWSTGIINPTAVQRAAIVKWAIHYLGTPYSWTDYAALAAHRLHLLPAAPLLKNYVASTGHMICSQLVDTCYNDAGYHLFADGRWPGDVTPGDLWQLLLSDEKGK
jgi:cell wall-associated NlpC family hydrolase